MNYHQLDSSVDKTHLQGQAAVWQVACQLALRGHNPLFPGVDYGYDLKLENGLRLQVKSSRLKFFHPAYSEGVYSFDWRQLKNKTRSYVDYSKVADYFVLWGVDENRFWIFPCAQKQKALWLPKIAGPAWIDPKEVRTLYKGGMTQLEIADKFKTSQANISRTLRRTSQWNDATSCRYLREMESRWDLLDTNSVVEKLVESAEPLLVPKEQ